MIPEELPPTIPLLELTPLLEAIPLLEVVPLLDVVPPDVAPPPEPPPLEPEGPELPPVPVPVLFPVAAHPLPVTPASLGGRVPPSSSTDRAAGEQLSVVSSGGWLSPLEHANANPIHTSVTA